MVLGSPSEKFIQDSTGVKTHRVKAALDTGIGYCL